MIGYMLTSCPIGRAVRHHHANNLAYNAHKMCVLFLLFKYLILSLYNTNDVTKSITMWAFKKKNLSIEYDASYNLLKL